MIKFHLVHTGQSTRTSRALVAAGPPHPERIVKRPPTGIDSRRGMVAYGPAAGTRPMRPQPWLANAARWRHWLSLPFGWTLVIEGKHRGRPLQVWEE